jgi:hypothetical protein
MVKPFDFSVIRVEMSADQLLEKRFSHTGLSSIEYEGWAKKPNASTAEPIWYIVKYVYDAGLKVRQQLPDEGPEFEYIWDDRATYFS